MAIDYLSQLVQDFAEGRVDLGDTLNRLEFLDWKENKKPLPDDYIKIPRDPADIIIEEERQAELRKALVKLKSELSNDNWNILVEVSKGRTYESIGKEFGISHQAISKRLATIRRHAEGLDVLLRITPTVYEASSPKDKIAYPMDAAKKNKKHCEIPEYLLETCGKKIICCYCEKCTRKTMN